MKIIGGVSRPTVWGLADGLADHRFTLVIAKVTIDLIKRLLYYGPMDVFSALAEPTRRGIIEMLASQGRLSASQIAERFPVSAPAISQHLKVLREAKLVRVEKRAQQRIYQINPAALLEMAHWVERVREQWDERFDALDRVLESEKQKAMAKRKNASDRQEGNDGQNQSDR